MFFTEPPTYAPRVTVPSFLTPAAVTVGAAVTIALGIAPQPLLDLVDQAGQFAR